MQAPNYVERMPLRRENVFAQICGCGAIGVEVSEIVSVRYE